MPDSEKPRVHTRVLEYIVNYFRFTENPTAASHRKAHKDLSNLPLLEFCRSVTMKSADFLDGRRGAAYFRDRACRIRSIIPSNETDSLSLVLARNSSRRKPVVLNRRVGRSVGRSVSRLALSHDAIFERRQ